MFGKVLNYLIIIFIGRFVLDLFLSGEMAYLIHPRYIYFTVAAAIISIIVGFIGIIFNFKTDSGKKPAFRLMEILKLGLVFILIYLPNFSINPLSSATFSQRALDLNTLNLDEMESSELAGFVRNTENITLGEWVRAINLNPNLEDYVGKNVKVSGFVFKQDNDSTLFMVSRFVVTCCAVDARPVGIFVDSDEEFNQDDWIEVRGVFEIVDVNGEASLVIKEKEIKQIDIPSQPYIY